MLPSVDPNPAFSHSAHPDNIYTLLVIDSNADSASSLSVLMKNTEDVIPHLLVLTADTISMATQAIKSMGNRGLILLDASAFSNESLNVLFDTIELSKTHRATRFVLVNSDVEGSVVESHSGRALPFEALADEHWVMRTLSQEMVNTLVLGNLQKLNIENKDVKHSKAPSANYVVALERRLVREKNLRISAQTQLNDYARKSYVASTDLRQTIEKLHDKQQEIEFFLQSARELKKGKSGLELINSFLSICVEFISAEGGACFFTNSGKLAEHGLMFKRSASFNLKAIAEQYLPSYTTSILDSWSVQEMSEHFTTATTWFLATNFKHTDNSIGWLCFIVKTPQIDEQKLYILDSYLEQLRMSIAQQREIADQVKKLENGKLEAELADTKRQLLIADRMSSLGFLSSGVAHEINNPLAFLIGNNRFLKRTVMTGIEQLQALRDASSLTDVLDSLEQLDLLRVQHELVELFEDNEHGLTRLSTISKNLRQFIRTNDEGFAPLDLIECVKRSVKIASMSKKVAVSVVNKVRTDKAMIYGNEGEIEQVLLNIIINAIQAVAKDGLVTVVISEKNEDVIVSVEDNGCGIAEDNLTKIFSPFFTLNKGSEGTGLGLGISKTIVDAHNGSMTVNSVLDVGTTFSVTLPKHTDAKIGNRFSSK